VVLGHSPAYIPVLIWLPLTWQIAITANAYHGVSIFFTISGFLITSKLLEASDAHGRFSLWTFYVHRVARIAPCLVLMIALACAVATLGIDRLAIDWAELPAALLGIFTFTYNTGWFGPFHGSRIWDPLWSLSVEEMFYLGFPLIMLLMARRRAALIAALVAITAIGPWHRSATGDPYAYLSNFDDIALGALAALLARSAGRHSKLAALALRCIGAAIIAVTFVVTQSAAGSLVFGPTFMGLGAAAYLAGSAYTPGRYSTFVLERFGSLSYEVYLFHMFLLVGFHPLFIATMNNPGTAVAISFAWFVVLIVGLLALGEFSARCYSEPANRVIRRLLLGPRPGRREQDAALVPIVNTGKQVP
jgi:peptidoglycan/LPS O-acetylase OafA/YrhL